MTNNNTEASLRSIEETKRLIRPILTANGDSSKYQHLIETKQLARPNFKLIQELVKSLIVESRVLRDLFNSQDFDAKLAKDRQHRLKFVQRLIEFAAQNKQPVVGCLAAKIVSGQEPIKALELLQSLARITQARLVERSQRTTSTFVRSARGSAARRPIVAGRQPEPTRGASRAAPTTPIRAPADANKSKGPAAGSFPHAPDEAQAQLELAERSPVPTRAPNHESTSRPLIVAATAVPAQQKVQVAIKEYEIEQNIQLVRGNLKSLRALALELGKARQELCERLDLISKQRAPSKAARVD